MPATATPEVTPAAIPTPAPSVPNPGAARSVDPTPEAGDLDNDFFGAAEKAGLVEKSDVTDKPPPKADEKTDEKPKLDEDDEAELRDELNKKPQKKEEAKKQDKPDQSKEAKEKSPGGQMREKLEASIKELEQAKARIKELESNTKPSEESKQLTERIAALEKERDEARSEVSMLKEGETPEFKQKYEQPFAQATERAAKRIEQLVVRQEKEDGSVSERAGNFNTDFIPIYQQTNYAKAQEMAEALFGKHAGRVMADWETLHDLREQTATAKQELQKNWQQTTAQRTAEQAKQREAFTAALAKVKESLVAKYPDRFGENKDDAEVNRMLQIGKQAWEKQPQTFQEAVTKAASTELAVTAHPRLVYTVNKLKKENEALAAKLKEYEESEPGKTKRKGGEQVDSGESDEEADLRALRAVR